MNDLLHDAYQRSVDYQRTLDDRSVFPSTQAIDGLSAFDESLPNAPQSPESTLNLLDEAGSPATVASTGGRYYGFVTGGALPVTHAANWLATTWDQNGASYDTSPVVTKIETVALNWLVDLFGLPAGTGGAFVTGATMANFTALAAARGALLRQAGWNVEADGLFGAPEIKVIVGEEVHVSVLKALSMVGLGRERVTRVPVDEQGRMRSDALPQLDEMTLVCLQVGNVNSGAFDPARAICEQAREAGAWVHIDGAFGLWALATDNLHQLGDGIALADSWATDAHKWLNVPYDSGIVLCRDADALRQSMRTSAAYLTETDHREPYQFGPEFSRRARGIEVWAALRTLGKTGIRDLIEAHCAYAKQFESGLTDAGFTVHNEVVLNQVVVSFGDAATTLAVIDAVQREGTMWAGKTVWQGNTAMRISVSGWATTPDDVQRSLDAIVRCAEDVRREKI